MLKSCLVILALIAGCQTKKNDTFQPDVYVGSSETETIRRNDERFIKVSDIEFNDYFCIHKDDFELLYNFCVNGVK